MARAGITKYQVEKAYQTLVVQGVHPSIDALRIELGNTGSKTTISRYLKEIEAAQCVQLEDEALLSEGIKEVIAKLASKLHQEANEVIHQSKSRYQDSIKVLEQDNNQLKQAFDSKVFEFEESRAAAMLLNSTNEELNGHLSDLKNTLTQSNSKTHELKMVIIEKDKQIQSLNENHQHTRDSLVHYRDSVKVQRDQEHRQHEQQVQQLQLEFRQVNQTLIVKQVDITELNKDNSRLVTELSGVQKQMITIENKHDRVFNELQNIKNEKETLVNKLKASFEELEKLKISFQGVVDDNKVKESELRKYEQYIIKLETKIEIKSELLSQFELQKGTS